MRHTLPVAVLLVSLASCGDSSVDISGIPDLPETTTAEISSILSGSPVPVVVNVWASWCIPCRSEAPLLERAAESAGDTVTFIGLNVQDDQEGARGFIAEFFPEAPIDHYFDPRGNIPVDLGGGRGVPLTFFYAAGGELVELHSGVIDERTLALQIDEILSR
jgi:cytochrome c biogenesis protein CcmG/thiol:disulfide interchange protein DsbE